jgi:hypothetical protein
MDVFREKQHEQCAIGGIHCHCCNPWRGHNKSAKRKLNSIARLRLKREDRKNFKIEVD